MYVHFNSFLVLFYFLFNVDIYLQTMLNMRYFCSILATVLLALWYFPFNIQFIWIMFGHLSYGMSLIIKDWIRNIAQFSQVVSRTLIEKSGISLSLRAPLSLVTVTDRYETHTDPNYCNYVPSPTHCSICADCCLTPTLQLVMWLLL